MAERDQTPTGPNRWRKPRVLFLPFNAAEFRDGWSLDWSPELQAKAEEPKGSRRRTRRDQR